jgi:hypothetical protein
VTLTPGRITGLDSESIGQLVADGIREVLRIERNELVLGKSLVELRAKVGRWSLLKSSPYRFSDTRP